MHIIYHTYTDVIYIYDICNYLFFWKVILLRIHEDADCMCICNMYVVYVRLCHLFMCMYM